MNASDTLRGMTGDPAMERLGHLVAARRQAVLGSRSRAEKASGVGRQTWIDVEGGVTRKKDFYDSTKARMMTALGWTVDSWGVMLSGGDPVELEPEPEPPDLTRLESLERRFDALEAAVRDLLAELRDDPPAPPAS